MIAPAKIESVRLMASAELNLFRHPVAIVTVRAPFRFADVPILGELDIVHAALPTTEATYGRKRWQRQRLIKLSETTDLNDLSAGIVMKCLLVRDYKLSYWDTMESIEAPDEQSQGVARLHAGATRIFTRGSSAWVISPAALRQGARLLVALGNDIEALTAFGDGTGGVLGTLIEQAMTNEQIQSSFANGLTGWISAGTGSNGSAIATDTGDLLFQAATSGNSIKFTAGNPIHVADLQISGTATASILANTICRVSVYHKDDSGAVLYVAIQRSIDSRWWKDSNQTWQVAKTWNPMNQTSVPALYMTSQMNVGGSNTTLTAVVGIPTAAGVPGQINHAYHVQIEKNSYTTSVIVTGAATVTRSFSDLHVTNEHGKLIWPLEQGTAFLELVPEWDGPGLPAGNNKRVLTVAYDASNEVAIRYTQSTGSIDFIRTIEGVSYTATKAEVVARGSLYKIAVRWTGAESEYGLAPYTLSVFVNGVKGTDAVASGIIPAPPSSGTIYVGANPAGSTVVDALLRRFRVIPFVLSDTEVAGLAAVA